MKTYFEAYRERLERNERYIFDFAKTLKEHGFEALVCDSSDRFISHLIITKENKHVRLDFGEVPYCWKLSISWKPNVQTGSRATVMTHYDLDKVDFTIEDVEKSLYPNYQPIRKMYGWAKLIDVSEHPRYNN